MSVRFTGLILCGLAMVTVGSTVVASKLIASGVPPFTATALRFAIAFPILVLLMHLTRTAWPRPGKRDGLLLLLQAGSGSVGYTVLLITGMGLASAVDAGAITGTLPAVAAAVAIVALGERPDRKLVGSIALATIGVLVLTVGPSGSTGGAGARALLGNALVLGAVVCEALFILLNKKLRTPISPLPLSTLMTGIGLVLAAGPALLEQAWTLPLDALPLAGIVYYALVPTVGGFLLWYAGSMRISGAEASLMTAVAPLSAVLLAAIVLRETVDATQIAGLVCVVAAVGLAASRQLPKEPRAKEQTP